MSEFRLIALIQNYFTALEFLNLNELEHSPERLIIHVAELFGEQWATLDALCHLGELPRLLLVWLPLQQADHLLKALEVLISQLDLRHNFSVIRRIACWLTRLDLVFGAVHLLLFTNLKRIVAQSHT